MRLIITKSTAAHVKQCFHLHDGASVQVRPGHKKPVHDAHQVLTPAPLADGVVKTAHQGGLIFFITNDDEWFFSGLTTTVDYQRETGVVFRFVDSQGHNPDAVSGASNKYEWMWY